MVAGGGIETGAGGDFTKGKFAAARRQDLQNVERPVNRLNRAAGLDDLAERPIIVDSSVDPGFFRQRQLLTRVDFPLWRQNRPKMGRSQANFKLRKKIL